MLEEVWQGFRGPGRAFLQGLIQSAVAFHHAAHGNPAGARSVIGRALGNLRAFSPGYGGIDVAALVDELERWEGWLADAAGPPAHAARPSWRRVP